MIDTKWTNGSKRWAGMPFQASRDQDMFVPAIVSIVLLCGI